jgi:superfamily I DNA/RNA helicase
MNFTQEQHNIINSNEKKLKINAVAGSGKTTTLLAYASKKKNLSILYLAYNRAIAQEISRKLEIENIKNIHVTTIHALAYRAIGVWNYKIFELDEIAIGHFINSNDPIYSWLIKDLVSFYCNSRIREIDDILLSSYIKVASPSNEILAILSKDPIIICSHVQQILSAMKNKKISITHDFYLKLYYLYKPKLNFDLILVDEAQDISDVMSAIIERQSSNTIYVGDGFQQIYSFRFAINALEKIDTPSLKLTRSFRFGDGYAQQLSTILNQGYSLLKSQLLEINGEDHYTKIGFKTLNLKKPYTVIARSNISLFEEILKRLDQNKKIFFEGGYGGYGFMNKTIFSILKLHENKSVDHELIKQFDSIESLKKYTIDTQNQPLKNMITLVEKYDTQLFSFNKKIKTLITENRDQAQIIYTTTHKAKGEEYDQVIMSEGDFTNLEQIKKMIKEADISPIKIKEEINIYYVAATRVKNAISLASFDENIFEKPEPQIEVKTKSTKKDIKVPIQNRFGRFKQRYSSHRPQQKLDSWLKDNGY